MLFERYERSLRYTLWLPIAILVISLLALAYSQAATGSFIQRDVELTGGKMIVAEVGGADVEAIREATGGRVHVTTGVTKSVIVEVPFEANETEVISAIRQHADVRSVSVRSVGPALGELFFQQTLVALVAAFIAMSLLVLLLFRSLVPSSIVVLAAATDIIGTLGVMSLAGIPLSLPVLAALLMLIGYSVDTDILLTNRLLKDEREFSERLRMAVKTGMTMTLTTLAALTVLFFATGSFVLEQIALVLIIGLLIDMPATWFANAGILLRWVKKRAA